MPNLELDSSDVRAIGIFVSYLSICILLTGLIVRDLAKQHNLRRNRRSSSEQATSTYLTSILAFSICAAVSLGVTWYYMLGFFSLSYRTWALQHGIDLPTRPHNIESLGQWLKLIRLGAWLKDVQLFRDAWEVTMESHSRLVWSQPIFFIATSWAFFVGERGMSIPFRYNDGMTANIYKAGLQRIRHRWAYMLLGQIVAVSFAQSLFYVAVTLYESENSEHHSSKTKQSDEEGGGESVAILGYTVWHRIIILLVLVPVILLPATVQTPRFLWVLAIPHLLLMVPPILDPVLIGRMPKVEDRAFARKESARLYRFCVLCAFIAEARMLLNTLSFVAVEQHLHRHSAAYIHPILESASIGANSHWHGVFASLYDHPAVTSVGWDSILCILNYQTWRLFQRR